MVTEQELQTAQKIYRQVCGVLDARGWKYREEAENLRIELNINGKDIPMHLWIIVDAERQLIRILSPLPFDITTEKQLDTVLATTYITSKLAHGGWEFNAGAGRVVFRMANSYRHAVLGDALIDYMIDVTCTTVDGYNDKFLMLNQGVLSVAEFLSSV